MKLYFSSDDIFMLSEASNNLLVYIKRKVYLREYRVYQESQWYVATVAKMAYFKLSCNVMENLLILLLCYVMTIPDSEEKKCALV